MGHCLKSSDVGSPTSVRCGRASWSGVGPCPHASPWQRCTAPRPSMRMPSPSKCLSSSLSPSTPLPFTLHSSRESKAFGGSKGLPHLLQPPRPPGFAVGECCCHHGQGAPRWQGDGSTGEREPSQGHGTPGNEGSASLLWANWCSWSPSGAGGPSPSEAPTASPFVPLGEGEEGCGWTRKSPSFPRAAPDASLGSVPHGSAVAPAGLSATPGTT